MGLTKGSQQENRPCDMGRARQTRGSTKVQVALLTKAHQRSDGAPACPPEGSLLAPRTTQAVGRRRRFLTYLQKHDLEGYRALIKELGLTQVVPRKCTPSQAEAWHGINVEGWRFERAPLTTLTRSPLSRKAEWRKTDAIAHLAPGRRQRYDRRARDYV